MSAILPPDLAIIVIYLLFITWRGIKANTDYKTTDDFFLAGRSLKWPAIGLSLYATNISISSIIGLGGSGYQTGISVFNYEWVGTIMLLVFAVFIVPYYFHYKFVTMPQFLEHRFDGRSRLYFSIISITANVLIDIAGALYASSLLLKGIFPDTDQYVIVLAMAALTGIYTFIGGLRAVVITDTIQAVLLTIGAAFISWLVFNQIGSWEQISVSVSSDHLSLIKPLDDDFIPWPTLIISLPILGFYFMCSNQHMVQRVLAARSVNDARKGAILAGFLKLPLLFILVLPGTMGQILYPDLQTSNMIFPTIMFDFLPVGILGIVLTGFIAALMSSIDSALTAASSIATIDIYKKLRPESSDKHLVNMGKIFILIAVFIGSIWAPFIDNFPTLWEYLQAVLSFLAPPVVTCFMFGLLWNKASSNSAFYTLIFGSFIAFILILNNYFVQVIPEIHYLYSATIIFVASSIFMVITSYISPDSKQRQAVIADFEFILNQQASEKQSWYKDYKLYVLLVLLLTIGIVYLFR